MKIKSIEINNFKGLTHLNYSPSNKICALIGENGAGKTSFLQAVRFGITGEAPEDCIKSSTDEMGVEIVLDSGLIFSRTKHVEKPSKIRVNGKNTTAKSLAALLEEEYGIPKEAAKISTSREVLEALNPAEFGDFIMKYIPEELDFDTLCSYIPDLTSEKTGELLKIFPAMPRKFDISLIQDAQSYFFEQRKNLKRELEQRNAKIVSFVEEAPARDLKTVEALLADLMEQKGSQAANKAAISLYESAVKNREMAEKNLKALHDEISAISASKPAQSEIDAIKAQMAECQKQILGAEKLIHTISDNLAMFKHTVENLGKAICPLSERLVCTTDKTQVRDELLEIIASNEEGIKFQEDIIATNKTRLADLTKQEEIYAKNKAAYDKKVLLNARYESEKKSLPVLPPKPAVVTVKNYDSEIAELQAERDAILRYIAHTQVLKEYETINERLGVIASLYSALEPKGVVMTSITAHYLSVFESVINDRASKLRTGFEIMFVSNDGVRYYIKTRASRGYQPYEALSKGEQTMAAFLLLDMLNTLCGTKLLFIDDLNHLDRTSAQELLELINTPAVLDAYDHIFIASVNNPDIVDLISLYTVDQPLMSV